MAMVMGVCGWGCWEEARGGMSVPEEWAGEQRTPYFPGQGPLAFLGPIQSTGECCKATVLDGAVALQ